MTTATKPETWSAFRRRIIAQWRADGIDVQEALACTDLGAWWLRELQDHAIDRAHFSRAVLRSWARHVGVRAVQHNATIVGGATLEDGWISRKMLADTLQSDRDRSARIKAREAAYHEMWSAR